MTAAAYEYYWESESGEFWTTLKIFTVQCVFLVSRSIEYRDTWDGIVIVAFISGIAQHVLSINRDTTFIERMFTIA